MRYQRNPVIRVVRVETRFFLKRTYFEETDGRSVLVSSGLRRGAFNATTTRDRHADGTWTCAGVF